MSIRERKPMPPKLTFLSNNHPDHPFEALDSNAEWRCDGKEFFGNCKSNINKPFSPFAFGLTRYKCMVCKNFDFCERCLRSRPLAKNQIQITDENDDDSNETVVNSPNHAHPLKLCLQTNEWSCDGLTVFGICKAQTRRVRRTKRFKCTVCANFDLCEHCLNSL